MSDSDTDFREDIKRAVRRNDPDPETLRAVAADFEELADRFEVTGEVL